MTSPEAFPHSVRIVLSDEADPSFVALVEEVDDRGKTPDDKSRFKLPGGRLEPGETPTEAAQRELPEEVGITAEQANMREVGTLPNLHNPESHRYIFAGQIARSAIRLTSETSAYIWITRDTIPAGPNQGHIQEAIDLALSEQQD